MVLHNDSKVNETGSSSLQRTYSLRGFILYNRFPEKGHYKGKFIGQCFLSAINPLVC